MKMNWPLYIIAGAVAILALYAGFSGKRFLFIQDTRTAVIVLGAAGFAMCSSGAIGWFVNKAPAHPLTLAGYILGAAALLISLVQLFQFKWPLVSNPNTALTLMLILIILKVGIGRLKFLLPAN